MLLTNITAKYLHVFILRPIKSPIILFLVVYYTLT